MGAGESTMMMSVDPLVGLRICTDIWLCGATFTATLVVPVSPNSSVALRLIRSFPPFSVSCASHCPGVLGSGTACVPLNFSRVQSEVAENAGIGGQGVSGHGVSAGRQVRSERRKGDYRRRRDCAETGCSR